MPITSEQRERRRGHLGASDVAAVLGLNPFRSAYDIFLEKTQKMDQPESAAMDLGNRLEAAVLDYAEEQLGPLERSVELISPDLPFMGSNLDARVIETQNPVEAKTSGILWRGDPDAWGDDGSSVVPDYIAVQCYAQMFVSQKEVCFVPALIGGRGLSMFTIPRDEETMKLILERCQEFWLERVMTNTPPDDSYPSLDVVKRIQVDDSAPAVELPDALIEEWLKTKEAAKEINAREDQLTAMIKALFGPATLGKTSTQTFTCKEQFKAAHPVKECRFRVLRPVKPKKK